MKLCIICGKETGTIAAQINGVVFYGPVCSKCYNDDKCNAARLIELAKFKKSTLNRIGNNIRNIRYGMQINENLSNYTNI